MADLVAIQHVLRPISAGHLKRVLVDLPRVNSSSEVRSLVQHVLEGGAPGLRAWYVPFLDAWVLIVLTFNSRKLHSLHSHDVPEKARNEGEGKELLRLAGLSYQFESQQQGVGVALFHDSEIPIFARKGSAPVTYLK